MSRRVVRVQMPVVHEYDVVFDDGRPIYIGAVIRREASASGPNAGKVVETHRTTWDCRGDPWGVRAEQVLRAAMALLTEEPNPPERAIPAHVDRAFRPKTIGRPMVSAAAQMIGLIKLRRAVEKMEAETGAPG